MVTKASKQWEPVFLKKYSNGPLWAQTHIERGSTFIQHFFMTMHTKQTNQCKLHYNHTLLLCGP